MAFDGSTLTNICLRNVINNRFFWDKFKIVQRYRLENDI